MKQIEKMNHEEKEKQNERRDKWVDKQKGRNNEKKEK